MTPVTFLALAVAVGLFPPTPADIPNRTVKLLMHEDPADPASPIAYEVRLHLEAEEVFAVKDVAGGDIAWYVAKIDLLENDPDGSLHAWFEDDPFVDTPSGLWRTTHDDLDDLRNAEFAAPPAMDGIAAPLEPDDGDLVYVFEGGASEGVAMYDDTGFIDLAAETEEGETTEEDDEPVEVDTVEDP